MPESKKQLTIVMACYNDGLFLEEAVRSVNNCISELYDFIIVDDGSNDPHTLEVLDELRHKNFHIVTQPNKGLSAARNHGISLSNSDYILPLDCDNKLRPDYLVEGIRILDIDPRIGVVYGNRQNFGKGLELVLVPDFDPLLLACDNYIDACAVFRKKVWEDCGGYDENLRGWEDWEFWINAYSHGWQFYHASWILFDYRTREDSLSHRCTEDEKGMQIVRYMYQKHASFFRERYKELYDLKMICEQSDGNFY